MPISRRPNINSRRRIIFLRRRNKNMTSCFLKFIFIRELHCKFLIHRKSEVLTKMIIFLYQMLFILSFPSEEGNFVDDSGFSIQIVYWAKSWRRILKSWRRVGLKNYFFTLILPIYFPQDTHHSSNKDHT